MIERLNLVLAGVGGQGTLVAGKLLGLVATSLGLDVRVSEVHGMAQRGGSVITYVRMAPRVHSPIVEPGAADIILAFEELEALRWAHLLGKDGVLLINKSRVIPMSVGMGQAKYPENIIGRLQEAVGKRATVRSIDASDLARQAGSEKSVNIVMIGAMAHYLAIPDHCFAEAINQVFPKKLQHMNQKAYRLGSDIMKEGHEDL
ncbi:MAG: indolepyruvate oxidoreductase subunit beta [Bacillota bacterium]|nr:indolepyruvate oxidoreductase subunit beta [Bacillota bacterium]